MFAQIKTSVQHAARSAIIVHISAEPWIGI